jgi:hypothetical protein
MARKRAGTVLALMERIERFTLARAWTDLGDDEFFWEPAANCWGVHPRAECRTANPYGDGDWVADYDADLAVAAAFSGEREPMTTIGWLLWHIGSVPGRTADLDIFGGRETMASGWTSPYLTHHPVFSRASDATESLRAGWSSLRSALEQSDDEVLETRTPLYTYAQEPPRDGLAALGPPGPELPAFLFVTSTINEVSHHGAQVCTLRDLYRWSS